MERKDRVFNLVVKGGHFTDVHGNYYVNNVHQELGIFALSQAISTSAIYDSAMRYPAGKCHPGTRETIIKTILEWVNNPSPSCDILWLCGSAGSGKSAIMHTIVEKLQELHAERYGGSFFFAKGVPGRDEGTVLFSTLAYQLATNFFPIRELINRAITIDPTLPTKEMKVQLKSLLVDPLSHCDVPPPHPHIMIIDGLDECGNSRTQREILTCISKAITVAHVPFRFLIASRPEFAIWDSFDRPPLVDRTQQLNLDDSEHVSEAFQDIMNYLQSGFDEIYEMNLGLMGRVERPWPSKELLDRLVYHASGQFIYAATVLKFVGGGDSDFNNPKTQLEILATDGPWQASAFSDLDQLYKTILSLYPKRNILVQVLGGLQLYPHPKLLETYLDIDSIELGLVIRAISSLIHVSKYMSDGADLDLIYGHPPEEIQFCHLSFMDFLDDESRSGYFSIDYKGVGETMFTRLQDLIISSLDGTYDHRLSMENIFDIPFQILTEDISADKVLLFVNGVQKALEEFSRGRTSVQTTFLLRLMRVIQDALRHIHAWRGRDTTTEQVVSWSNEHEVNIGRTPSEEILQNIETIADNCIQEVLSDSRFAVLENMAYFAGANQSKSLEELAVLPGLSKESAKAFLIHGAGLVRSEWQGTNSSRRYTLETHVYSFLSSKSRGGRFYYEFRRHFIRICRVCLDFLLDPWEDDGTLKRYHSYCIFAEFLRNESISDLVPEEDEGVSLDLHELIETMCTGNNYQKLSKLNAPYPPDGVVLAIVRWLHRQLNQNSPSLLLEESNGNLKTKMLNALEKIGNVYFLQKFDISFFSDDEHEEQSCLSNLTFPPPCIEHLPGETLTIPPFDILPFEYSKSPWQGETEDENEFVMMMLSMERSVHPRIDGTRLATILLEWHMICCATQFHSKIALHRYRENGFFGPRDGFFAQWFVYAGPSKKIQAALWTIYYLCSTNNLPWRPPPGFCFGVMDFLEKYELDQDGRLTRWLEDLLPRQHVSHYGDWFETPECLISVDWVQDEVEGTSRKWRRWRRRRRGMRYMEMLHSLEKGRGESY